MSSILTQIFHTTLGHAVNFVVEIVKLYFTYSKTVKYGTETISYLAPKTWLDVFESKIRQWKPDCHCPLCRNYLQHVGFI